MGASHRSLKDERGYKRDTGKERWWETMGALKFRENGLLWLLSGAAVIALLAGADAGRESEGFFVGVRAVVCFASAYAAVAAFKTKRESWAWLLGANAALYNPFLLVRLTRDTWKLVDLLDIVLVLAAAVVLRARGEKPTPASDVAGPVTAPVKARQYRTPSKPEIALWLILLALCLAGAALTQFYGVPEGAVESQKQAHSTLVGSMTFGLAFWGYVVARMSRWRRPGRVALGSFLAGLLAVVLASVAGGYARGTERNAEMSAVVDQIGQFDPALAARLRAGKDGNGAALAPMMSASLTRALQQAPDAAVVTFAHTRYDLVQSDTSGALKRCVAAFQGGGNFGLNAPEQLQMLHAMGTLFSAAATNAQPPMGDEEMRATVARLTAVYKQVDPNDVLDDEKKRAALTEQEQCDLYTRLMQTLWTLPPRDAATAIRAMLAA